MRALVLLDLFRQRALDTVQPYLWSDDEVLGFVDQAQTDFVRLIGGLRDTRSDEVCLLSVGLGDEYADISPKVLAITHARLADGAVLAVVDNGHDMAQGTRHTGTLRALVVGEDEFSVRLVNIADQDYEIRLNVRRLPLAPVTRFEQELEVRDEHAPHLLPGMLALAYIKPDSETHNADQASRFQAEFVAKAEIAAREGRRLTHAHRTVAYGGL